MDVCQRKAIVLKVIKRRRIANMEFHIFPDLKETMKEDAVEAHLNAPVTQSYERRPVLMQETL